MNNVFMFSGQGSQYYQMGRALFEANGTFRRVMRQMDAQAADLVGQSVVAAIFDRSRRPSDLFDRLLLTSPAILMTEIALLETLRAAGVHPDMALGASLGSYAAAVAAGGLDGEEALGAVIAHARALESRCSRGAMMAILAERSLYERDELRRHCELAATHFAGHFVVSMPSERVAQVGKFLEHEAIAFQLLPVAFAFHSPWIEAARDLLVVPATVGGSLAIPLACCAHADTLTALPQNYFWTVARLPIRFDQMIATLEAEQPHRYIDVGPAGTLATFLKYSLGRASPSRAHKILSPVGDDLAALDRLLGQFSTTAAH